MQFGNAYQQGLIAKMGDRDWMESVGHLLHCDMFLPQYGELVKEALKHYVEGTALSRVQLTQLASRFGVTLQYETATEFDYEEVMRFATQRRIREALAKAHVHMDSFDFDAVRDVVVKAFDNLPTGNQGTPDLLREDVDIPARAGHVATGMDSLDEILGGGPASGDVMMVMASTSGGKSSMLVGIGAAALRIGHTVFHATLEVGAAEIGAKYRRNICSKNCPTKEEWDSAKDQLAEVGGKLYVREHAPGTATVRDIEREMGADVTLCIIDYDDYIRPNHASGARHEDLGAIYDEMKRVAMQRGIPIIVAAQANRVAYDRPVILAHDAAGSIEKARKADQVVTINVDKEAGASEPGTNNLLLHVAKNRHGVAGNNVHCYVDFGTCRFISGGVS